MQNREENNPKTYQVPVFGQSEISVTETETDYIVTLEKAAGLHPQELVPLIVLFEYVEPHKLFRHLVEILPSYTATCPAQQLTPERWLFMYRLQQFADAYTLDSPEFETVRA